MLKRIYIYLILSAVALVGCIENDIPYPTIFGAVKQMEIVGQIDLKIDASKRRIEVVLSDTVDLREVQIASMTIDEQAHSSLDSGAVINLTDSVTYAIDPNKYKFTVTTFQDYQWQIVATQPIKREIVMSGSIGDVQIDEDNLTAIVSVAKSQSLTDIVVEKFTLGPSNAVYSPNPYTISNFEDPVTIDVSYLDMKQTWTIIVEYSEVNVTTKGVNPWGLFAFVEGIVNPTSTATATFEYRQKDAPTWNAVDAVRNADKISATITGLLPNIEYEYKACLGEEDGEVFTFKTETTPTVPNLSFENYYFQGSTLKTYFFNRQDDPVFWSTGNPGVTMSLVGKQSNTIPVTGADARTGAAVKMTTISGVPVAQVAAGNLFTGLYKAGLPLQLEEMKKLVVFGRPYKGRPTKLTGWFKYTPKTVDIAADKKNPVYAHLLDSIGRTDWCHIYVKLEKWPDDWDDTQDVRPDPAQVTPVAYGEFRTNTEVKSYTEFAIDIKYKDLTTRPNHIVIIATSSINGGDFCGGTGSTLWVDEFKLSFSDLPK